MNIMAIFVGLSASVFSAVAVKLVRNLRKRPNERSRLIRAAILDSIQLLIMCVAATATLAVGDKATTPSLRPNVNAIVDPATPRCDGIDAPQFPSCSQLLFTFTNGTCIVPDFVYANSTASPRDSISAFCASLEISNERVEKRRNPAERRVL